MIKRTGCYGFPSLFDHFDVHEVVSIEADGHIKVHENFVMFPRLEHRDSTADWSDWQVDIGPIQLRRQTDKQTWQFMIKLSKVMRFKAFYQDSTIFPSRDYLNAGGGPWPI